MGIPLRCGQLLLLCGLLSISVFKLGVSIDAAEAELLALHLAQRRNINGAFPAAFVPPGRYVVQTYVRPDPKTNIVPTTLATWQMAKKELNLATDAEVILTLTPAE